MTRRAAVSGAGAGIVAACATPAAPAPASAIEADLETYAGFGAKNAGGDGDAACGQWVETRLLQLGYRVERQMIDALAIDTRQSVLVFGEQSIEVAVHDLGARSGPVRIEAPLVSWHLGAGDLGAASEAIIVAHLPSRRWSSAMHPDVRDAIARASAAGAAALILVTHGPTGELIHLNRRLESQAEPVLLMAPRTWSERSLAERAAETATLLVDARQSRREAFNVIGRLDRAGAPHIVISTPRSGWGICAAERGPGVAAFLSLAAHAARVFPRHSLVFACTSSHEFENAGAGAFIDALAPRSDATALWLHLGAGLAAREWHEAGDRLMPLPSADPQRFLIASPEFVEPARTAFAGLPGLEAAYPSGQGAAGELGHVLAAGYRAIGMFGAHRFHHTALDDMRCVEPAHTIEVVARTQRLLEAVAGA